MRATETEATDPVITMTVQCCTCPATVAITARNAEHVSLNVAARRVGWGYRWINREFDCPVCKNRPR